MATLPTDADSTPNYTAANHATHHNTIHGLWNLLTTKGDLFVATAAQAFARLGVGPDGQVLTADSAEASGVKWAAQSGTSALLAVNAYNPGSLATYSTTSTTSVDVDATNMAVTFTVPASGNVLIRLSALTLASTTQVCWQLRQSTTVVSSDNQISGATVGIYLSSPFRITGLTPAASLTYKWGYRVSGAATGYIYAGGVAGVAMMEVWSAP